MFKKKENIQIEKNGIFDEVKKFGTLQNFRTKVVLGGPRLQTGAQGLKNKLGIQIQKYTA